MKIIDIPNPDRINKTPVKTAALISNGNFVEQGFLVKKVELKQYIEKFDEKFGPYSIITVSVKTDKGEIEMIYEEGFRGESTLEKTAEFISKNLGISALITRSLLSLETELKKLSS